MNGPEEFAGEQYGGDGHAAFAGSYRVLITYDFVWDGHSMSDVKSDTPSAQYGATHLYENGCRDPVVRTATHSGGVKDVTAKSATLWISSSNPIQLGSPAIDASAVFAFTDPSTLRVTTTTDRFPSYGLEILKAGQSIATAVDFDASCDGSTSAIVLGLTAQRRHDAHHGSYLIDTTKLGLNLTNRCGQRSGLNSSGRTSSPAPIDLSAAPYFATADGNITCGLPYYRWSSNSPNEPAEVRNDVVCRIAKHTVAPTSCAGLGFEAGPGVFQAPDQYASFTCLGEEGDKLLEFVPDTNGGFTRRRQPYATKPGEQVDLGPVTCSAQAASIDCVANNPARHHFHLAQDSFASPLLESDSVKVAENPGNPSTYASSAVVRPTAYGWGEYSSFKNLVWTEWTNGLANGAGSYSYNTCKPDCASAHYRLDQKVTLTFEDPRIVCGQWFFTKFDVQDTTNPAVNGTTPIAPDTFSASNPDPCLPSSLG